MKERSADKQLVIQLGNWRQVVISQHVSPETRNEAWAEIDRVLDLRNEIAARALASEAELLLVAEQ